MGEKGDRGSKTGVGKDAVTDNPVYEYRGDGSRVFSLSGELSALAFTFPLV